MNAHFPLLQRAALSGPAEVDEFFAHAASLLAQGAKPETIVWRVGDEPAATGDLFCGEDAQPELAPTAPVAPPPPAFIDLARRVLLHSDTDRHDLCYRLLWRLRSHPRLMSNAADPDVSRLDLLARNVRRDMHKMTAFVRFRSIETKAGEEFVAWFEPDHHIVAATAPFFVKRFASMRWSILTPRACARWDGGRLTLGPGADKRNAPSGDALETMWRAYYGAIFNPARLNLKAMSREMPKKYWRNMPEARRRHARRSADHAAPCRNLQAAGQRRRGRCRRGGRSPDACRLDQDLRRLRSLPLRHAGRARRRRGECETYVCRRTAGR